MLRNLKVIPMGGAPSGGPSVGNTDGNADGNTDGNTEGKLVATTYSNFSLPSETQLYHAKRG